MDVCSCPGCGVGAGIPHFPSCYLHFSLMETHMIDRKTPKELYEESVALAMGETIETPEAPQAHQVGGSHYQTEGIQPIDFIMSNDLPFAEGNAIKYTFRHAKKNGAQDIRKAIHYLQFILEKTYGESL